MQLLPAAICLTMVLSSGQAASDETPDNGTNPTRLTRQFASTWEYFDLAAGTSSEILKLNLTLPIGTKKNWNIRWRLPVTAINGIGHGGYAIGDASVQLGHVFGLTQQGGYVGQVELIFDTADRPELGTGKNVIKGSFIKAHFLKNGAIFAPALEHRYGHWGDGTRDDINTSALDFYYVPKLDDARNLITVDPSVNINWRNDKEFLGLGVTYGRVIGSAWGGNAIISIKPSLFAGQDRPGDWSLELGFKVIGF